VAEPKADSRFQHQDDQLASEMARAYTGTLLRVLHILGLPGYANDNA
jgi:hypothetical protein